MRKLTALLATAAVLAAASAQAATVAIVNARILSPGVAGVQGDTLLIRDGKVVWVGGKAAIPADAQVIDAKGGYVTPGFTAVNSALGAVEISMVGDDLSVSTKDLGAAFDIQYALNPDSAAIPVARLGGITSAVVTPRPEGGQGGAGEHDDSGTDHDTAGGATSDRAHNLFAGQAAVIQLAHGQEMLLRPKVAMVSPFGEAGAKVAGGARGANFVLLKEALADTRAYMRNRAAYERAGYRDLSLSRADLEALIPVVEGRMPLVAVANRASDIRAVLKLARDEKIKLVLTGAAEAWRVGPEIAAAGVPVILNPVLDRPTSLETLGARLENAGKLEKAGVTVAIEGASGAHRAHEMRYNAGIAIANGMSRQGALAAITINPARIFGVADRLGSLHSGKDADLVIWSGDPFEPLSRPQLILVRGEAQPLRSRQLDLRDRYLDLKRPMPPGYPH